MQINKKKLHSIQNIIFGIYLATRLHSPKGHLLLLIVEIPLFFVLVQEFTVHFMPDYNLINILHLINRLITQWK